MKLTDFLQELGRPVAYYPRLSHITGGVKETLFLCQLLYWEGKQSDKEGWIYKTQEETFIETGLTRYEQQTARKNLKKKGFIEEKLKGIPAKLHYKINFKAINEAWELFIVEETNNNDEAPQTSMGKSNKLDDGEVTNNDDETLQTNTETTTEITTKTTTEKIMLQKNCNDNSTLKFAEDSTEITLARFMVNELLRIKPNSKVPNTDVKSLQNWAQHIDYMIRIDEREPKEIAELFRWAQEDDFWCANIRSPKKLREKWDTLELQRNRKKHKGNNNISKLERMYQEALREEYDV